jgi:Tol biopolymer transport system component
MNGLPLKASRTIEFSTTEGTHMSVDVSPDGKTIVFDLLGDLYLLPIEGGKAKALTRGIEYDASPRFSPDGNCIAFTSDRSGASNIWTVDIDGRGLRQVTREEHGRMIAPAWSPDGRVLLASKHPPLNRPPAFWTYDVATGAGSALSIGTTERGTVAYDPSGRTLVYTTPEVPGASAAIMTLDIAGGTARSYQVAVGEGGWVTQPVISPDGRRLAYVAVTRSKTPALYAERSELRVRAIGANGVESAEVALGVPRAAIWSRKQSRRFPSSRTSRRSWLRW